MLLWLFADSVHQGWIDDLVHKPLDKEMLELVEKLKTNGACCGSAQANETCHSRESGNPEDHAVPLDPRFRGDDKREEPQLYIFMSFSVPKQTWQDLWKEHHKHPFQFVIRGLPNGGFQELALKMKDYDCPVMIHPDLFDTFNITQVPAFVLTKGKTHKGVYGNISLSCALEHLQLTKS